MNWSIEVDHTTGIMVKKSEAEKRIEELEVVLRDFLTTKECRETWIEEMHCTIEAILEQK